MMEFNYMNNIFKTLKDNVAGLFSKKPLPEIYDSETGTPIHPAIFFTITRNEREDKEIRKLMKNELFKSGSQVITLVDVGRPVGEYLGYQFKLENRAVVMAQKAAELPKTPPRIIYE